MLNQAMAITAGKNKDKTPSVSGPAMLKRLQQAERADALKQGYTQGAPISQTVKKAMGDTSAPSTEKQPKKKISRQLAVKTEYGTVTRSLDDEEAIAYHRADQEGKRQMLAVFQKEAVEVAKSRGLKPKKGRASMATVYEKPQEVTVEGELTKNLQAIEDANAPLPVRLARGVAKQVIDKARQTGLGQTLPGQLATGIAESSMYPIAEFAGATGNIYDPSATAEERVGALLNAGLYAATAVAPGVAAGGRALRTGRRIGMAAGDIAKDVIEAGIRGAAGMSTSERLLAPGDTLPEVSFRSKPIQGPPETLNVPAPERGLAEFTPRAEPIPGSVENIDLPGVAQSLPMNRKDAPLKRNDKRFHAILNEVAINPQKVNPMSPEYDERLHIAAYKALRNDAPSAKLADRGDGSLYPEDFEESGMYGTLADEAVKFLDEDSRFSGIDTSEAQELMEWGQYAAKTGGKESSSYIRVRRDRQGNWVPDLRNKVQFSDISELPPHIVRDILDFVATRGDSDTSFVTESAYRRWVSAGKGRQPFFKPMTKNELLTKATSDFENAADGSGANRFLVSKSDLRAYAQSKKARYDELSNLSRPSMRITPKDLDEGLRYFNEGESARNVATRVEQIQDLPIPEQFTPAPRTRQPEPAVVPEPLPIPEQFRATEAVEVPKIKQPEPEPDLVGFAKQITGRDPMEGVNRPQLLKAAEENIATGKVNPDAFIDDVISRGVRGDEEATAAAIVELRKIRNQQKELELRTDPDAKRMWNELQDRAERYEIAGDVIGNQWHRMGMALQIALKQDMSLGALKSRAKFFNGGAEVAESVNKKLEELSIQYQDALKQIEELKNSALNSKVIEEVKKVPGRLSVQSRERARKVASDYFQNKKLEVEGSLGRDRRRGAVTYTITPEEVRAKSAIRKLAKEIALDGAETLDDVLNGIRREIGVDVKDDDLLALIYEPYSKYKIEADVARIKANQALTDVQRAAEYRSLSASKKLGRITLGVLNGVQRSFQAGADFSAPLIQGRKGIFANPIGWAKAYEPMFRAALSKRSSDVALKELAAIENHPMYAKAKAAGLQITVPGGKFTAQEEMFAGNVSQMIDAIENAKGAKKAAGAVVKPYLRVLEASEDAFTTYMNALRYDTFVKMAKAAPGDPEYLKDIAEMINVIYGRGTGKLARAVGEVGGNVLFAPRYLVSNIQYQSGVPFFKANTAMGRKKAAQVYAAHVTGIGSMMMLAKMAGWEVGIDPRSTDFGKISNGDITIDLAGKDTQFIRLMIQILYGKVNKEGEFKKPSSMQTATLTGQFVQGKASPMVRALSEYMFGVYDDDLEKSRPMEQKDLYMKVAPLWVQDLIRDSEKWEGERGKQSAATIASIFGLEVKPKPIVQSSEPLDLLKPGIRQQ
jgi:hypothetical protein